MSWHRLVEEPCGRGHPTRTHAGAVAELPGGQQTVRVSGAAVVAVPAGRRAAQRSRLDLGTWGREALGVGARLWCVNTVLYRTAVGFLKLSLSSSYTCQGQGWSL